MTIEEFTALLAGVKGGPAQFTARCPAHGDRHNSLSVGLGEDGRILLKCHAGCETAAVLEALGLRPADLFPPKAGTPRPQAAAGLPKGGRSGPVRAGRSASAASGRGGMGQGPASGRGGAGAGVATRGGSSAVSALAGRASSAGGAALMAAGSAANGPAGGAGSPVGGEAVVAKKAASAPAVKEKALPKNSIPSPTSPYNGTARAHGETDLQICKSAEVVYPYCTAEGALLFQVVRRQLPDGGKTFIQRRPDGKGGYLYSLKDIEPVLYRLPQVLLAVAAGDDIVVCEGEKDADALVSLGLCATTAPMGAGKWREGYTESLRGARRVLVAPDNDKPGRAHALAVCASLAAAGVPALVADLVGLWPALPRKGDVSDVLEQLGAGAAGRLAECAVSPALFAETAARRDALDDAPPYRFDTGAEYLKKAFWDELAKSARQVGLSTGFKGLDRQLDGHLYAGLYVVGSVSSLGKTAFCLQMADAIAAQGRDVLFFTLEMSRLEMVARSLTRHLFIGGGFAGQATVGHLLHGKVPPAELEAAARAYHAAGAGHIAFVEGDFGLGAAQVADRVRLHHAATGRSPVVFVDYLQILRPPDVRMSDKQATDHNVIELKRLSRDLEVPVVAVSSFNRQNYAEEVNMASFKESGAIEYSADFVLGLQARGIGARADDTPDEKKLARMVKGETKDAKRQDPRPIEAVTLKNRRGPAWAVFDLDFYPRQNYFAEVGP